MGSFQLENDSACVFANLCDGCLKTENSSCIQCYKLKKKKNLSMFNINVVRVPHEGETQ